MATLSYVDAGTAALAEEMRADPKIFHLSTDAPPELVAEFGSTRVRATPIAEAMLAIVLMDHYLRHRAQCGDVACATPVVAPQAP